LDNLIFDVILFKIHTLLLWPFSFLVVTCMKRIKLLSFYSVLFHCYLLSAVNILKHDTVDVLC